VGETWDIYFWYKQCTLWVSYNKIWSILEKKFELNYVEIKNLCGGTVGETLKIKVDTTMDCQRIGWVGENSG